MLLECLRLDLLGSGVNVTTVHAGFVDTPMVAHRSGPMPQLISADEAAERIVHDLPRAPAVIDFPEPLATATRLAGRMPRRWRDLVVSRFAR